MFTCENNRPILTEKEKKFHIQSIFIEKTLQ